MAREFPPTVQQVQSEQVPFTEYEAADPGGIAVDKALAPGLENQDIQFDERFGPRAAPPPGTPQEGTFLVDPMPVAGDVDITVKPFREGKLFSSYSPEEQTEGGS